MPDARVAHVFVIGVWTLLRALPFGSAVIALENLALRHQLLVLQRSVRRPRLAPWDRIFWVWLCRVWAGWRSTLVIVQPATVLAWHRRGFQLYWRWKSRPNPSGRPRLDAEVRTLIGRMARENPTWGRRRIQAELALLGYEVAELTVAKYMHRTSPRPSPFLLRDRDAIYGEEFARRVRRMGIREVRIAPRAPWQNPFVERVIGSIRRECLDHCLIVSEAHLCRLLRAYVAYYNHSRPHQALENNSPIPREVQPASDGPIRSVPKVGGLHHHYHRTA
jgi:Integrase core domain